MSRDQCLEQVYTGQSPLVTGHQLPFYVLAYPFKDSSQLESHFTGIDLRYLASSIDKLSFRIKNTNQKVCPDKEDVNDIEYINNDLISLESQTCKPRCVEIQMDHIQSEILPGTSVIIDNSQWKWKANICIYWMILSEDKQKGGQSFNEFN